MRNASKFRISLLTGLIAATGFLMAASPMCQARDKSAPPRVG